jgi:hypothetical protein
MNIKQIQNKLKDPTLDPVEREHLQQRLHHLQTSAKRPKKNLQHKQKRK